MSTKGQLPEQDIFIGNKIFPNAADVFAATISSVAEIKKECLFVLDTNALLLPYTIGSKSVTELSRVYKKLVEEKRLLIPGQVAREFAKNRPVKIKELFQQLNRKRSQKQLFSGKYPLLEGNAEYDESLELERKIDELNKEYNKKLSSVLHHIKNWTWNDPVSETYKTLFESVVVVDPKFDESTIKDELHRRYNHQIPPGYKDESKADDGIGDLLIWYTILELGKKGKDVVFVSGEEKTDWFYKSEGQVLCPRFELVSEFRSVSNSRSFHIIKLSELLEMFGADQAVVQEVEVEEKTIQLGNESVKRAIRTAAALKIDLAKNWFRRFYSHRWIITDNHGFPDFILNNKEENLIEGCEIILIDSIASVQLGLIPRMRKLLEHTSSKRFSKMIFLVVFNEFDSTIDWSYVKSMIMDALARLPYASELIMTYIDEEFDDLVTIL